MLRPWTALAASAIALVAAAPATAEPAATLRKILSVAPATPSERDQLYFADLAQASAASGKRGGELLVALGARLYLPGLARALERAVEDPAGWRVATGFGFEQLDAIATFGEPPRQAQLFVFAAGAPGFDALTAVWRERGYAPKAAPFWGRGEPGRMDLTRRAPASPFGGEFGRGSFLLPMLPLLAEAAFPEVLDAVARSRAAGGMTARPDIAALLGTLDRAFPGARLLNAVMIANPTALAAAGGIAPYSALMIADLQRDAGAAEAALLLAFADCATASAAKAEIERRWPAASGVRRELVPAWTVSVDAAPCPLIGRVRATADPTQPYANAAYSRLRDALFLRALEPLNMRRP